jgi:hypothetical protein
MASADSHHTNLDAAESLLLLAGWQPQALQHHIQSSNADAAGRRARPPTQFISTTCQICSAVPQVSLTDSIVAESASAPAVSSLGWADSKRQVVKVSQNAEPGNTFSITEWSLTVSPPSPSFPWTYNSSHQVLRKPRTAAPISNVF